MAITVPYAEMYPFPRGRWQTGHFIGQRKLLCKWGEAANLALQIGTYPDSAWPAAQYQFGPTDALAREITIEPHRAAIGQAATGFASYEYAELTVKYSTSDFTYVNGALVKERFTPSPQSFTIEPRLLQWGAGQGLQDNEAPSFTLWGMSYQLEYHNLSTSPPDTTDWVGYVNSNTVATKTLGRTMAPETLLYAGSDLQVRFGYVGGFKWTVRHYFEYRKQGWNNHPRLGAGGGVLGFAPVRLRSDNSVVDLFPSTTF